VNGRGDNLYDNYVEKLRQNFTRQLLNSDEDSDRRGRLSARSNSDGDRPSTSAKGLTPDVVTISLMPYIVACNEYFFVVFVVNTK